MSTEVATVAQGPAGPTQSTGPAGGASFWVMLKQFMGRLAMVFLISSLFRGWKQQGKDQHGQPVNASANLYPDGMNMDLYFYINQLEDGANLTDPSQLFWHLKQIPYGLWDNGPLAADQSWSRSDQLECPPAVQRNGSLFLHLYITKSGYSPNPSSPHYSKDWTIHRWYQLNKYRRKKYQKTKNLLTGETDASLDHQTKADTIQSEVISYWHPNLTISIVYDQTMWTKGQLPNVLTEAVVFHPIAMHYYPIVYFNDYWNLLADYQPINDTVTTLNLSLTFAPLSLFKWQLYASQTQSKNWLNVLGVEQEDEADEDKDSLKQTLLETSPYLIGLTVTVSLLHTVFEFLAFKNDIMFWRNRENLEGLSVRSVLFNVSTSVIVLLYVMDNDTNFVVRMSVFVGLVIDLWKIPKCLDISLDRQRPVLGLLPRPVAKEKVSYVESNTKEYDIMAFKYLSWVLFPLFVGYAVYSLVYLEHRGWYSWLLSMMYGFLLTFGFIMMTPQLFINYKLKSVAHLPWRMLTYKFLNTIIDDLFAFVIKMPTLYRIGCFRDDVVFLIYVYQRWAYRVDPNRTSEYDIPRQQSSAADDDHEKSKRD